MRYWKGSLGTKDAHCYWLVHNFCHFSLETHSWMEKNKPWAHNDTFNSMIAILLWWNVGLLRHGFSGGSVVKHLPAMWETWVRSLGWEDPLEGEYGNPLQYSCLENPHGQRSLEGYSPWSHKESDKTEWLTLSLFSRTLIQWYICFVVIYFKRTKFYLFTYLF